MASQTQAVLDAAEVTQAVQDLNHSVTLIAGKTTVVRLYVRTTSGPTTAVRGAISVRRAPADPATTIASVNTVTLDPAQPHDLAAQRGDATLSLNFVLPGGLTTEGPLSIGSMSVIEAASGLPLQLTGPAGPTVWFKVGPPLRLRILGFRYRFGSPPTIRVPREVDYQALVSWLKRAYPVADVISTHTVVDAVAPPEFSDMDINAQLAAMRALDMSTGGDPHTHYYGMVADSGFYMRGAASGIPTLPDPSTVASGPTGPADFGWDFDGVYGDWYGAHELGHTFGRKHPGFCSESKSDLLNYPFDNGQIGDADHAFVGFDVGDPGLGLPMKALPGERWHDVMTYCDRQWLSSYTYEGIRRRLLAEDALVSGRGPIAEPPSLPPLTATAMAGYGSGGRPDERHPERAVTTVASTASGPRAEAGLGANGANGAREQLVSVVGTVNLTRHEGGIRFVNPVNAEAVAPGSAAGPDGAQVEEQGPTAVLRVLQHGGAPPTEIRVPVKLSSELPPGAEQTGLIDAVAAVGPEAEGIELIVEGRVVDAFRPTGPPPVLRAARHADTEEDGAMGMALEFDRAPAPEQTYSAQVSADGGRTWQTIGVGLKEPTVHLDRSQFSPGDDVRLRITTTNGFSSTTSETEPFG